jgi:aminodeoxyfutalosine synthase
MMETRIQFRDSALVPVWHKVLRGERLNLEDGLTLYRTGDIISLGKMAHHVSSRRAVTQSISS